MKLWNYLGQELTAGSGSGIAVEEVDGTPAYTGITTIRVDQADGFVLSQPGAGIARIDFSGGSSVDQDARTLAYLALMGF